MIQLLVRYGADPSAKGDCGWTPLMWNASDGCRDVCEFLLRRGASVHETNNGSRTALDAANEAGHVEVVKLLLEHGAATDPSAKKKIVSRKQHQTGEAADQKQQRETQVPQTYDAFLCGCMLSQACQKNHKDLIEFWFSLGRENIDVTQLGGSGFRSALSGAIKHGDEKLVDRLLNFGAVTSSEDLAVACGKHGDVDIVRRILDSAEPDKKKKQLLAKGEKGSNTTPLHEAAQHNHFAICEVLVAAGADPLLVDINGESAVKRARDHGRAKIAKFLKECSS
jgi:ankyrin repeat protein